MKNRCKEMKLTRMVALRQLRKRWTKSKTKENN